MEKQSYPKIPDSKWVYFVYHAGSPVGVFSNVNLAIAFYKYCSKQWGNPSEGALTVVRYRPAVDMYRFKSEDITDSVKKVACHD